MDYDHSRRWKLLRDVKDALKTVGDFELEIRTPVDPIGPNATRLTVIESIRHKRGI